VRMATTSACQSWRMLPPAPESLFCGKHFIPVLRGPSALVAGKSNGRRRSELSSACSWPRAVHTAQYGQRGPWQLHVPAKLNADGTYPKDTHESSPSSLYDKHKPQVLFGSWWGVTLREDNAT
jgi:hypothetical protein